MGLVALSWIHRILFLESNRDCEWPFSIFYQGDAHTFFLHARALLEGGLHDEGVPFHPPGFPTLLAAIHSFLGAGGAGSEVPHLTVKVFLALLSSLAVGLLFLLVRPYLGRTVALVAGLLCTWHFGLYVLSIATVSEGVFLTLQLAALLLFTRLLPHPLTAPGARPASGRSAWLAALGIGALWGVLALFRAESVLPGFALGSLGLATWSWGWWQERRRARPDFATSSGGDDTGHGEPVGEGRRDADRSGVWRRAGSGWREGVIWLCMATGFLLALAPWTIRNYVRMTELQERMAGQLSEPLPTFVPLTIYGPLNLALANRDGADGAFSPEAITGWTGGASLDFRLPSHLGYVLHGDEMAWQWISDNPGDFVHLVWKKWGLYLGAFDLGFGQWNWPGGLDGIRRPVDIFVPDSSFSRWPWLLLGLAGWVLCVLPSESASGRRQWAVIVALFAGAGFATTALFFGYARLGLLLIPFVASLVAVALVEGVGRWLGRSGSQSFEKISPQLLRVLGVMVVLILAVEIVGARGDRNFRASASSTVDGHHLNPDDEVRLELIDDDSD